MRFRVKEDDLDEFDVEPSVGWYCSYTYACTIEILEIEKCGCATPTFGVYMAESNGNTILGGTVASKSHGGIHIAKTCERNTWLNMPIGRAHVCTPVANANLVCRLMLEYNKRITYTTNQH